MDSNWKEDLLPGHPGDKAAPVIPPAPTLNAGEYMGDLADFDLSEAQKVELLETLWSIMGSFARLGLSVDVCGLIFDEFNQASAPESGDGRVLLSTQTETPSKDDGKEGQV